MALIAISGFLRATSISWKFGIVEAQIPIAISSTESKSKGLSLENNLGRKIKKGQTINDQTITILLTRKSFYFGTIEAFTKEYMNTRNKFQVDHLEGAPQIDVLLTTINLWSKNEKRALSQNVIFIPTPEIPMPIVIQTMAYLKEK